MKVTNFLYILFTLCACSPSVPLNYIEQSSHLPDSVEVPPGPVTIPTLPSASSALGASQILCDSFQLPGKKHGHEEDPADTFDLVAQCFDTANSFYKELQVQLVSLINPSTVNRALESMDADTTFLFPDGSYTQGRNAFRDSRSSLFGGVPVTAIQNKFIYKPINKDTVILIGDPNYTLSNGTTVESVQYHVYTRRHKGEGSCRSLSKLSGKICWAEVAGEWAYRRPFTGTSYPHPISTVRPQIPTSPTYPLQLEPQRIICDGSFEQLKGNALNCDQVVREFYKEIQFQILTLTNPDTITSGLAALNEQTTFVYPTGLVTEGLLALLANAPSLFGANSVTAAIENKFFYKGLDSDTVLFIGDPMFTMLNVVTNETRPVESVQVSVYRRNKTPLGNCRSATNINGEVCWTEVAEQWVYGQPMLGD